MLYSQYTVLTVCFVACTLHVAKIQSVHIVKIQSVHIVKIQSVHTYSQDTDKIQTRYRQDTDKIQTRYVSWCGGESWVDQRVPRAHIHDVALLL